MNDFSQGSEKNFQFFTTFLKQYHIHILVFLVTLFLAITFAHPSFFVNDEWITANQLSQLHDGSQLMYNEGKYGSYDNGTVSGYFTKRNNILGYSLFLPIISLPVYWLLDFIGDNSVFFLIYLWTFLLIAIALLINNYLPSYAYFRNSRWTTVLIIGAFVLFFSNFFVYKPFFATGKGSYPEILAIVFTHMILFAILSVIIFEINRTVFHNLKYALFGTFVCISCSSYLFWTSCCKDHLLVAFLFGIVVLFTMKLLQMNSIPYLWGAFVFTGLLAWARPELAFFVCISLCCITVWRYHSSISSPFLLHDRNRILISPLFTLLGAIPFFINNYLFTRNILVPVMILLKTSDPTTSAVAGSSVDLAAGNSDMTISLISFIISSINIQPSSFLFDLYGIFFNPQTGAQGLFPIMPLVLCGIILLPILIIKENVLVTLQEKPFLIALLILSLGVFFAYFRDLHGMNTSVGINPDIRYLSPMYLPLNIIGLMLIAKIPGITENAGNILKWIISLLVLIIPASLFGMAMYYPFPDIFSSLFSILNMWSSVTVYCVMILFLVCVVYNLFIRRSDTILVPSLAILCLLPLVWQIDTTYLMRYFGSGFGGYSFWIPVMLQFFAFIF